MLKVEEVVLLSVTQTHTHCIVVSEQTVSVQQDVITVIVEWYVTTAQVPGVHLDTVVMYVDVDRLVV